MRFSVDPWDPAYGVANEADELEPTKATVNAGVELAAGSWRPLRPLPGSAVTSVLFVDGVRRIEARVWLHGEGTQAPVAGICASFAAGAVRCNGPARVGPVIVGRGLFTSSGDAAPLDTTAGPFPVCMAAGETVDKLSLALQQQMGRAEREATEQACAEAPADLVVVDGPLRGREHLEGTVGYVKTHHVSYLTPELNLVVGALAPGERSPLFVLGTSWSRIAWYARLPGTGDAPWAGVVRCECSPELAVPEAAALADQVTATLQRFASEPHKEPRAPQNLYPIAGLERELRRRLGDPLLVYRALRKAARASA